MPGGTDDIFVPPPPISHAYVPQSSEPSYIGELHALYTAEDVEDLGMSLDADVIVVGAGLAGLAAARKLHDAGLTVVVLEARDRLGGRMHAESYGGVSVEVGASHVWGSVGNPLTTLLDEAWGQRALFDPGSRSLRKGSSFEVGVESQREQVLWARFAQTTLDRSEEEDQAAQAGAGRRLAWVKSKNAYGASRGEAAALEQDLATSSALPLSNASAAQPSSEKPFLRSRPVRGRRLSGSPSSTAAPFSPEARTLASSLALFASEHPTLRDDALDLLCFESVSLAAEVGASPASLASWWVEPASLTQGVARPAGVRGVPRMGGPDDLLLGSSGTILAQLARDLDVRMEQAVVEIEALDANVSVYTEQGERISAQYAIVTTSLGLLVDPRAMLWSPPLPEAFLQAASFLGRGIVNRVVLWFDSVFWRDDADWQGGVQSCAASLPEAFGGSEQPAGGQDAYALLLRAAPSLSSMARFTAEPVLVLSL
ncbi:hypothetical protein H632_c2027p0, partial [Helicosporidium sp. ATCC 50920]